MNTKELIAKTVEAVDKGSRMTVTAAEGFGKIIGALESFATMAHDVSESATAQAQALQQVEAGVGQISMVTTNNAASSEECSAIIVFFFFLISLMSPFVSQFLSLNKPTSSVFPHCIK